MKQFKLLILLLLVGFVAEAQINYLPMRSRYTWIAGKFDSTITIPYGLTPSIRTGGFTGPASLFYKTSDSTVYVYTGTQWISVKGAGGSSDSTIFATLYRVDTAKTNIRTSLNAKIDSLRRVGLNVQAYKNGTWITQFTDSVGTGGGVSDTSVFIVDTLYNRIATTINVDSLRLKSLRIQNGGVDVTPETTDSTVSWSIRSDTTFSKPLIGDIYNKTSWANLTDFTDTSGYSISGDKIIAASDPTLTKMMLLNDITMLNNDSITVKVVFNANHVDNHGFTLLWKSTNTTVVSSCYGWVELRAGNADFGKIKLYDSYSTTTYTSSTAYLAGTEVGDTLTLTFSGKSGLFQLTATNETKSLTGSYGIQQTFDYATPDAVGHNTARVGFEPTGGTYTILSVKYASSMEYRPKKLFVGTSITKGSYAGSASARFAELQGGMISAGGGDKTAEVLSRVSQITDVIRPQTAFLEIGTNDIFQGIASATWQANYTAIVDSLEHAGITVWKLTPPPSNSTSMAAVRTWLLSTYPTTTIDIYVPLLGSGSGLNPIYNSGDGTHLNALANRKIDTLIDAAVTTIKDNKYVDQFIAGEGIKFTPEVVNGQRYNTISYENVYGFSEFTRQKDTITLASFTVGSNADTDTSAFSTSAIYGSFYNDGSDTLIITSMRGILQGSSPSIAYKVFYNDSLNIEAGATSLVTAGTTLTNTVTGSSVTSFDQTKIPPGVWVWLKSSTITTKPKYFSLSLVGYKKRK